MNKKPSNTNLAEVNNLLTSKASTTFNKTAEHGQNIKLRNKMTAKTGDAPTVATSGDLATVANHKEPPTVSLPASLESEKPLEKNITKIDSPRESKQENSKSQNGELKKKIYRSEKAIKELKAAAQLKAQVKVNVTVLDKDVFQSAKMIKEKNESCQKDVRIKSNQNRDATVAPDSLKSATGRPTLIRRHVLLNNLLGESSNKLSHINNSTNAPNNSHGTSPISAQQTSSATASNRSFFDNFCPNLLMENSLNNNSTFQNARTPGRQLKRSDSSCKPQPHELPLPSSSCDNQTQSSQLQISSNVGVSNISHRRHHHEIGNFCQRTSKNKLPSENGFSSATPSEAQDESDRSSKTSVSLADEKTSGDQTETLKNDNSPSTTFSTVPIRYEEKTCETWSNSVSQTINGSPQSEPKTKKGLVTTVNNANKVSDSTKCLQKLKTAACKRPKGVSVTKPCSKMTSKFFKKCLRQSKIKTWSLKKEKSLKQKGSKPDKHFKEKIFNLKFNLKKPSRLTNSSTSVAKTSVKMSFSEPLKSSFLDDSFLDLIKFKKDLQDCNKHSGYDSDKTDIFDYDEDEQDTMSGSKTRKFRDESALDGGIRAEEDERIDNRSELGSEVSYDTTDEDMKILRLAALNLQPTKDLSSLSEVFNQANKKTSNFSENGSSTLVTVDRSLSLTDSILKLGLKKRLGQELFPEFELAKKKYKRSHRIDELKPVQKFSEKRWLREKKRHYFEYDSNELRACKKLSLLEAKIQGLEGKVTPSETSSESRSETPSSRKSADFKSERSMDEEQKKIKLDKIHKKSSKLKIKEAGRCNSIDSSCHRGRDAGSNRPLTPEKNELSGKTTAENMLDTKNARKDREDRFRDKKENGSVRVLKSTSNDAENLDVTLRPEDCEDQKLTKKAKKHRKHKLVKVVEEAEMMAEKKEKGKSGRKKKRPIEETCPENLALEKSSSGILSVSESVILSRELGPKFNWLEHKIQQNYKNGSTSCDSTALSTAAPTQLSLFSMAAATTASQIFNSISLPGVVAADEENRTGLILTTAEKRFREKKTALFEEQKAEKRQRIPSTVEQVERTMKESSLGSAKHLFALSTLRVSQHGDQITASQRENKNFATAKLIRKDSVSEGIPISVFLNKFTPCTGEPTFQTSSDWSTASKSFSTLLSSSNYAIPSGSSSSEKVQQKQNTSKFDSARPDQALHMLSNHHPHSRDAFPIRTEILSEKRVLTGESQISARQPSFELSDPVLLQEYRHKFDNYLKIKQISESKQKEILKLETEKERLKRELVSLLRMGSEGKPSIPGSRQCKPMSVLIPSPPSIYAQKFLKKSAPVSPSLSTYPVPPSWSIGNSMPSDDLVSSRFEKIGGGIQSKTVPTVSHHYPPLSDLSQLHDKLQKQIKLSDHLMYSQQHPMLEKVNFTESSAASSDVSLRKITNNCRSSLVSTEQLFHQKPDKSVSRYHDLAAKDRPPPSAETLNYCYSVHKEFLEKAKNFTHSYESPQILLQSLTVVGKPKTQDRPEKPLPIESKILTSAASPDVIITSARIGPSPQAGATKELGLTCDSSPFLHLRDSAAYQRRGSPPRATRSADTSPPEETKHLNQLPESCQNRPLDSEEKTGIFSEKTALDLSVRVDQHRPLSHFHQPVHPNQTKDDTMHIDKAENLSLEQENSLVLDLRKGFSAPLDLKVKQTVTDICRMKENSIEIDYELVDKKSPHLLKTNNSELRVIRGDQPSCETSESATKLLQHSNAIELEERVWKATKNQSVAEPSLNFPEWYKENSKQSTATNDQNTMAANDDDDDNDPGKNITLEKQHDEEIVASMSSSLSVDVNLNFPESDMSQVFKQNENIKKYFAYEKSEQLTLAGSHGHTVDDDDTSKCKDSLTNSLLPDSVSEPPVLTIDELTNNASEPRPMVSTTSVTSSQLPYLHSITPFSKSSTIRPLCETTCHTSLGLRELDSEPPPLSSVRSKSCEVTSFSLINNQVPSDRSKSASLIKTSFSTAATLLVSICQNSNLTKLNVPDENQASATDLSVKEVIDENCLKNSLQDDTFENSKPDSLSSILNSLRAEETTSPVRDGTFAKLKEDKRVARISQDAVKDSFEDTLLNLSLKPAVASTAPQKRPTSSSASQHSQFAKSPHPGSRAGLPLKVESLSKSPGNHNDTGDEIASNNSMMMMMMMMMPKSIEAGDGVFPLDSEKFNAQLDETIKKELQNFDKTEVMLNSVDLTSVLSSPRPRNTSPSALTPAGHGSRFIEIKRSNSVEEISYQPEPLSRMLSPPLVSQMGLSSKERDDSCLSSDRKHSLNNYYQRDHQLQLTTAAARQQYQFHEPPPSSSLQQFHHPNVPFSYADVPQQSSSHHPSPQRHQQYQQQKYSQNVMQQLQLQLQHQQQLELRHRSQHSSQAIKVGQPTLPDTAPYPKRQGSRSDHDLSGVSSNQDKFSEHIQRKLLQNQPDFLQKQRHFLVENGHDSNELTYYNQLQSHPNIPRQIRQQNLHHFQQLQQHPSARPCSPTIQQINPQRTQQQQELQRLHSQQKNLKYPPQPALNPQFIHSLSGGGVGAETQDPSQVYLKTSLPSPRVRESSSFRFKNLNNTIDNRGYQQHLSLPGFSAGPSQPLLRRQESVDAKFLKHPLALKHLHEASKQQQEQLIHKPYPVDAETLRYHQKHGRHYERPERFDSGLQQAGRPPPYYKIYNEPSLHMSQGRLPQDHHNFRMALHSEFDTRNQVAKGFRGMGPSPPSATLTAVANEVAAMQSRLSEEPTCFNCPRPAHFICSTCKNVYYCSRDCQAKSWEKGHKDECRPSNG